MKIAPLMGLLLSCFLVPKAYATEGGLGRPITGLQGTSYAGEVPPTPGFTLGVNSAYYSGDIGAERETPVGNSTALGLEVTADLLSFTGIYIWNTGQGRWNFATAVSVPFAKIDASAALRIGEVGLSTHDSDSGLYDAAIVPVMASRHFGQTDHLSLALYIFAPTGSYDPTRLATLSLNTWTLSPTVGYTHLGSEGTLEFSAVAAVDFDTENDATDYQNGALFRLDGLLIKRFGNGWGIGAAGGLIHQLENDSGTTADRLGGFKGRSLALGPIVTYAKKWDGGQIEFSARWLTEFDVKNRFKGDPMMLTATIVL
ncbi:MAG: transporter [Pseudoxanthomonas sp.]